MNPDEYQVAAGRTLDLTGVFEKFVDGLPVPIGPVWRNKLAIMGLGLAGESGEVVELIKKHVGHQHPLDREKLKKEIGDVLWYVAAIATLNDLSLEAIMVANVEKLNARYPSGFDPVASQNRKEEP